MEDFLKSLALGISCGAIYALIAVSYVIIYKATRVFAFSQTGLLVLGAYFAYQCLIPWHLPLWCAVIATIAMGAGIGFLLEATCMRPLIGQPIMAPIIVTLGLMLLLRGVGLVFWHGDVMGYGDKFLPLGVWKIGFLTLPQIQAYAFIICVAVITALLLFYRYTRMGLAMRVAHEDHSVAQNLGIRVTLIFRVSWILSCAVAVVTGILLGNVQGAGIDLDANGLVAIAAILLGGLESFLGAVIAGLFIGILQIFVIAYLSALLPGEITLMIPFTLSLFILIIKPYGFFGLTRIERI